MLGTKPPEALSWWNSVPKRKEGEEDMKERNNDIRKTARRDILLLAAALCFAACGLEEPAFSPHPAGYITFGMPALTVETRAATDGFHDEYPLGEPFGVLGY